MPLRMEDVLAVVPTLLEAGRDCEPLEWKRLMRGVEWKRLTPQRRALFQLCMAAGAKGGCGLRAKELYSDEDFKALVRTATGRSRIHETTDLDALVLDALSSVQQGAPGQRSDRVSTVCKICERIFAEFEARQSELCELKDRHERHRAAVTKAATQDGVQRVRILEKVMGLQPEVRLFESKGNAAPSIMQQCGALWRNGLIRVMGDDATEKEFDDYFSNDEIVVSLLFWPAVPNSILGCLACKRIHWQLADGELVPGVYIELVAAFQGVGGSKLVRALLEDPLVEFAVLEAFHRDKACTYNDDTGIGMLQHNREQTHAFWQSVGFRDLDTDRDRIRFLNEARSTQCLASSLGLRKLHIADMFASMGLKEEYDHSYLRFMGWLP